MKTDLLTEGNYVNLHPHVYMLTKERKKKWNSTGTMRWSGSKKYPLEISDCPLPGTNFKRHAGWVPPHNDKTSCSQHRPLHWFCRGSANGRAMFFAMWYRYAVRIPSAEIATPEYFLPRMLSLLPVRKLGGYVVCLLYTSPSPRD